MFAERVLDVSENVELPNRSLFLVSGNNLVLTGDTHRRLLLARLDAQIETPFKREFKFDPLAEICNNCQVLAVAALTIVRAYIEVSRPRAAKGRIASFELWDGFTSLRCVPSKPVESIKRGTEPILALARTQVP